MRHEMQARIIEPMVEADRRRYVRARDLPKLIAVWPDEIKDYTADGTVRLIWRIKKVLRAMHGLALRAHWSYEPLRHIALIAAKRAELERLEQLERDAA